VYAIGEKRYKYQIEVSSDLLNSFSNSNPVETEEPIGTRVCFSGIQNITSFNFDSDILNYLMREFGWFLELNSAKNFQLKINSKEFKLFSHYWRCRKLYL